MIPFFNYTYSQVRTALLAAYSSMPIGRKLPGKPTFPTTVINPIDNSQYERSMDSSSNENHVNAAIQIEVFSTKAGSEETECEAIMTVADDVMRGIGFVRFFCEFIPTVEGKTRLIARYRAIISKEGLVYRR